MPDPLHRLKWMDTAAAGGDPLEQPEWLVANGLGGYSCGSVTGLITRRYHGVLTAALPVPLGRMMMLDGMIETVLLPDGKPARLGVEQASGEDTTPSADHLAEFSLMLGLPVWRYVIGDIVIERRLVMLHGQNTVLISWRLLAGADRLGFILSPFLHVRPSDTKVSDASGRTYQVISRGDRHEIDAGADVPNLKLLLKGENVSLTLGGGGHQELYYSWEAKRGYDCRGGVWTLGSFHVTLVADQDTVLTASTEPWETAAALIPGEAFAHEIARRRALLEAVPPVLREAPANAMVIAADSFIITPPRREPRAIEAGDDPYRTVIAGYHWFTDWGRDTMISLEGLTLVNGRHAEARGILRNFAQHIRDGLIPNLFPEHESEGVYNTADATLWFFHAVDCYLEATGDRALLREILPKLADIIRHHLAGTRFGIGVDPTDGLLRQGAEGYQLTWMDAKVDGWVVTPRRGKAVEINALWYNALRLLAAWSSEEGYNEDLPPLPEAAEQAYRSFNERFWYESGGYLYDIVDGEQGDDASLRPNQVFAISLSHPVLDSKHWQSVLDVVEHELLTPVGLRSLAPSHPDYKPRYYGDLRSRDAAYHQGTVWAWLIGPFIDAWLKLHPGDRAGARRFLDGFTPHINTGCIGSISEIFDAEAPFTHRGCVAQAWSVAEYLRMWRKTAG
ncbi:MAG: amylo-alpha-1,6-glucosidase [Defluviicoccus sp.]